MVKRILNNELNIKDETRLANATTKLTQDSAANPFTFDDNVIPSMVCGIEQNQTDSSVDLISCIRDYLGTNRLTTDICGLTYPSTKQTIFNQGDLIGAGGAFFNPKSLNQRAYVTGIMLSNNSAAKRTITVVKIDIAGLNPSIALVTLLPSTTINIPNLLCELLPNLTQNPPTSEYLFITDNIEDGSTTFVLQGFYQ